MNALRILVEFLQQLCRAGSFACSQIGIWGYILLTFWKWGRTWAPLHLPVCFMLFLKGLTLPDLLACLLPGQPPHHPAVPSPSNAKQHHRPGGRWELLGRTTSVSRTHECPKQNLFLFQTFTHWTEICYGSIMCQKLCYNIEMIQR